MGAFYRMGTSVARVGGRGWTDCGAVLLCYWLRLAHTGMEPTCLLWGTMTHVEYVVRRLSHALPSASEKLASATGGFIMQPTGCPRVRGYFQTPSFSCIGGCILKPFGMVNAHTGRFDLVYDNPWLVENYPFTVRCNFKTNFYIFENKINTEWFIRTWNTVCWHQV